MERVFLSSLRGQVKRGHLHGAHDDLEARVVLDEEDDAVVEPHRGRSVERRLAVQHNVVRLSPVGQRGKRRDGKMVDVFSLVLVSISLYLFPLSVQRSFLFCHRDCS